MATRIFCDQCGVVIGANDGQTVTAQPRNPDDQMTMNDLCNACWDAHWRKINHIDVGDKQDARKV